jgi:hypothetical protein
MITAEIQANNIKVQELAQEEGLKTGQNVRTQLAMPTGSPTRLRGFNNAGRACTKRAGRRCWHRHGFPGSNGIDYDLDSGQCAFDFTLHALYLGLQECLQLLDFGHEPFEPVDRS